MDTAIRLHNSGVVDKIIVSGHQDDLGYDEPGSMRAYAIARGIPPSAVKMDTRGDRTYDTCYRAQHVFHLESVLLVTQDFHLPRALYTCNNLGVEADGVSADMRTYRGASWYELRETVATLVAFADLFRREAPDKIGTTASIE
jgi:SanA protein